MTPSNGTPSSHRAARLSSDESHRPANAPAQVEAGRAEEQHSADPRARLGDWHDEYQAVIFCLTSPASATVMSKSRKAGGHIDAMEFSGRKMAGGGAWLGLGRFMATPATLHIPIAVAGQPEEWEIRGQCYIRDTPVGQPSEIATVLVRG